MPVPRLGERCPYEYKFLASEAWVTEPHRLKFPTGTRPTQGAGGFTQLRPFLCEKR